MYDDIQEHSINLEISYLIRDILMERGYKVIMTRNKNETVSLEERAKIANENNADLFISMHINAFEDKSVSGIETWFNPDTNPQNSQFAEYIQQSIIDATNARNRGTYPDTSLVVLREVQSPSCLIEIGYITNNEERNKLLSNQYRLEIAKGIAEGVDKMMS